MRRRRSVHVHALFHELGDHGFDFRIRRPLFHDYNHGGSLLSAISAIAIGFVLRYLFFVLLCVALRFDALNAARFVHDAFVQPRHGVAVERAAEGFIYLPHVGDHRRLARGLVNGPPQLVFQPADRIGAARAAVEQPAITVDLVDSRAARRAQFAATACRCFIPAPSAARARQSPHERAAYRGICPLPDRPHMLGRGMPGQRERHRFS
jgi:hypothetical protein